MDSQDEKSFSLLEAEIAHVPAENDELKQHLGDSNDLSHHTVDVFSGTGGDGKSIVPNCMEGTSVEILASKGGCSTIWCHSFFCSIDKTQC